VAARALAGGEGDYEVDVLAQAAVAQIHLGEAGAALKQQPIAAPLR
jgi:hypothetical protein